jgi:hypothetical protein
VCKRKSVHVINIKILTSEPVCRMLYRCNIESVISVVNLFEYSLKLFKFYAIFKPFRSESWFSISPKDSPDVYVAFSKRIVKECLYSSCLANESGSYLKQYAVDCSDWVLLEIVFNLLKYETIRMRNQDYN